MKTQKKITMIGAAVALAISFSCVVDALAADAAFEADSAAFAGYAGQKASDFKVKLVGVSIERADADDFSARPFPPDKRVVVTPGNLVVFRLEYDFPLCRLYMREFDARLHLRHRA